MEDKEVVLWIGASGKRYHYFAFPLSFSFADDQNGNYIYAKAENNSWTPVYIGQGDIGIRAKIDSHHQSSCLKSKGVTHVHAHLNRVEKDRLAEEQDLLRKYPQAYTPLGCNEKKGG